MYRHRDKVRVQNRSRDNHYGNSTDGSIESKELIANLSELFVRDKRCQDGNVYWNGAKLIRKNLKSIVAVKLKPKQLLENLAAYQYRRKNSYHNPIALMIMFFADGKGYYNASCNHNDKPQNVEPAEYTRANVAVIDIAPSHIKKKIHSKIPRSHYDMVKLPIIVIIPLF
jgi:hypothetical protein